MALEQHHEDTPAFRQRFVGDVNKFLENFIVGHYRQFTAINNIKIVFDKEIVKSIKNISDLGEKQLKKFWNKLLVKAEVPIIEIISKNNL